MFYSLSGNNLYFCDYRFSTPPASYKPYDSWVKEINFVFAILVCITTQVRRRNISPLKRLTILGCSNFPGHTTGCPIQENPSGSRPFLVWPDQVVLNACLVEACHQFHLKLVTPGVPGTVSAFDCYALKFGNIFISQ